MRVIILLLVILFITNPMVTLARGIAPPTITAERAPEKEIERAPEEEIERVPEKEVKPPGKDPTQSITVTDSNLQQNGKQRIGTITLTLTNNHALAYTVSVTAANGAFVLSSKAPTIAYVISCKAYQDTSGAIIMAEADATSLISGVKTIIYRHTKPAGTTNTQTTCTITTANVENALSGSYTENLTFHFETI